MKKIPLLILFLVLSTLACTLTTSLPPVVDWPTGTPLPTRTPSPTVTRTPVPISPTSPTFTYPVMITPVVFGRLAKVVTGLVNGHVNMRECGSEDCAIMLVLEEGHWVKILQVGDWSQVLAEGKTGYINARYLMEAQP